MGNAEWTGPRLSDVLKMAGGDTSAAYVTANGADNGLVKTPDFIRSLPMRKALHPATLLALKMNGETLPALHGFPLRLMAKDVRTADELARSLGVATPVGECFPMRR